MLVATEKTQEKLQLETNSKEHMLVLENSILSEGLEFNGGKASLSLSVSINSQVALKCENSFLFTCQRLNAPLSNEMDQLMNKGCIRTSATCIHYALRDYLSFSLSLSLSLSIVLHMQ